MGVTVEARIVNKSTTVDIETLSYHGSGTTVAALTFSQALEYKHSQRQMVTTSGNAKTIISRRTVWFKSYLQPKFYDDSDFWGTSADKPSFSVTGDGYQYANTFYSADGTSTMSATMDRKITFHVKFFELAAIANSFNFPNEQPQLQNADEPEQIPPQKPSHPKVKGRC